MTTEYWKTLKQSGAHQTHHVYSTLKRHGNGRFHVVSTGNTRSVFVGAWTWNGLKTLDLFTESV